MISANIHRRHLTKAQIADLIVADVLTNRISAEPVSTKGGRGKKNPIKAAVTARTEKLDISDSEAKRAIARAAGKKPKPKSIPKGTARSEERNRG